MSSPNETNIDLYMNQINQLVDKYKDDTYMFSRLTSHINNILPSTLENEEKNHEKRVERNNYLLNEQQLFIQLFLNNHHYYYLPSNNVFYFYTGIKYHTVSEDEIHHKILTSISRDRKLLPWKYKTKVTILKMIKERSLFKSIPETDTIQIILHKLHPAFFSSRNMCKYFLTIIGDNLLKKNNDNDTIYITNNSVKKHILDIETLSYLTTGINNITSNIVTKYHENHNFKNCRLIDFNEATSNEMWRNILNEYGIDLLCVATHYSERYGSAEGFLNQEDNISDYVLYLKNNDINSIIESFMNKYIEIVPVSVIGNMSPSNNQITWKNMHYIWKLFINENALPNMIYSNTLKQLLIDKLAYIENTDTFNNITSKYLPGVKQVMDFWDKYTYPITTTGFDYELEVDEICSLLKKWIKTNNSQISSNFINENYLLNILNHYYPHIEITENKFILNINCKLWNKTDEINQILKSAHDYYKKQHTDGSTTMIIPINDIYSYYITHKGADTLTVNKKYFEKYISFVLSEFIEFDNFISIKWLDLS